MSLQCVKKIENAISVILQLVGLRNNDEGLYASLLSNARLPVSVSNPGNYTEPAQAITVEVTPTLSSKPSSALLNNHDLMGIVFEFLSEEELFKMRGLSRKFLGIYHYFYSQSGLQRTHHIVRKLLLIDYNPECFSEKITLFDPNIQKYINLEIPRLYERNKNFLSRISVVLSNTNDELLVPKTEIEETSSLLEHFNKLQEYKAQLKKEKIKLASYIGLLLSGLAGIILFNTLPGGHLMLTVYNMQDALNRDSSDYCLDSSGDGSKIGEFITTCSELMTMPSTAFWPDRAIFGCFSGNQYGPWRVSDLIRYACEEFSKTCTTFLRSGLSSGTFLTPNSDFSESALGMNGNLGTYCSKDVNPGFVFLFFTISLLATVSLLMCIKASVKIVSMSEPKFTATDTEVPVKHFSGLLNFFKSPPEITVEATQVWIPEASPP